MADVFVSYASASEAIVKSRLIPLRARGIQLWFEPDQGTIPAGAYYAEKIEEAIRACKVLLLMANDEAFKSRNVLRELEVAAQRNKPIVPLYLQADLHPPVGFGYRLALEQYIVAAGDDDAWVAEMVQTLTLYGVNNCASDNEHATRPDSKKRLGSGFLPYLANRDEQENIIQSALEAHLNTIPHRPIAFIVRGQESHCPDMFVDRLARYSLPADLKRLRGSDQLECISLRWPEQGSEAASPLSRIELYRQTLLTKLEQPFSCDHANLIRRIGALRRPVLFSSIIRGEAWRPDEVQFIGGIINWWSELPDIPVSSQPLLVVFSIMYPPPPLTLRERFLPISDRSPIAESLAGLPSPDANRISFHLLPELCGLSLNDVEEWVRDVMTIDEVDDVLRILRYAFGRRRKDAEEAFRNKLKDRHEDSSAQLLGEILRNLNRAGRVPMEPLAPFLRRLLMADSSVLRRL